MCTSANLPWLTKFLLSISATLGSLGLMVSVPKRNAFTRREDNDSIELEMRLPQSHFRVLMPVNPLAMKVVTPVVPNWGQFCPWGVYNVWKYFWSSQLQEESATST